MDNETGHLEFAVWGEPRVQEMGEAPAVVIGVNGWNYHFTTTGAITMADDIVRRAIVAETLNRVVAAMRELDLSDDAIYAVASAGLEVARPQQQKESAK